MKFQEEYKNLYSEYACCYVKVSIEGEKAKGCFTTSPTFIEDIVGCSSSNTNSNSNSKGNYNGDTDDDDDLIENFNDYNEKYIR